MIAPTNDNNRLEPLSLQKRSDAIDELIAERDRCFEVWQRTAQSSDVSSATTAAASARNAKAAREAYWQANSNLSSALSVFHARWKAGDR